MSRVSVEASAKATAETQDDRRRSQRARMLVRVDYATVDELFSEFTRDINEGGLFIETDNPRPTGTPVSMQFNLPGSDEPIKTEGRVVRVSGGEDGEAPGMGIEFDELSPEDRLRINQLVRTLRKGLPAAGGAAESGAGVPPAVH